MNKTILIVILVIVLIAVIAILYFMFAGSNSTYDPSKNQNISGNSTFKTTEIQGMKIEVLKNGIGDGVKDGDSVTVHYAGMLADGSKFDSSIDRNKPFVFKVGRYKVIKGWEVGILGMKVGEKVRLTIPPELGYGKDGFMIIPPNATLTFEIELLKIN